MQLETSSRSEIVYKAQFFKTQYKKIAMDKVPCKIVEAKDLNESQLLSIFHLNGYPDEVTNTTKCVILDDENAIIIDKPFVFVKRHIDKKTAKPIVIHDGLYTNGGYLIQQRLKKGIALVSYSL